MFKDAFVMDVEVADLKNGIQVENPFAFGKWRSALVEPRKSTPSTENLEIVRCKVDLHHSKQLSSFAKMGYYSTNFNSGSTRNAPTISNESHICKTDSEEVYAISKDNGSNNKVEQTKKVVPQKLTPVTILVIDTIFSVRSRTLLRVLLDPGSTTTLIYKRCLPRHCKPWEIASSRKVNTLAGTYTSTEVVIMNNLRLPKFNKNRNVNLQRALEFQSETCKYIEEETTLWQIHF
jgi:hypothetical protein